MKKYFYMCLVILMLSYSCYKQEEKELHNNDSNKVEIGKPINDNLKDLKKAKLVDSRVRLREEPNLECETIRFLDLGEEVTILEVGKEKIPIGEFYSNWYKVEDSKKNIGWMYGAYLDININEKPLLIVEDSTLIDRTVEENIFEESKRGYDNENGTIISIEKVGQKEVINRVFESKYNAKDYWVTDDRSLYSNTNREAVTFTWEKNSLEIFESSMLQVKKTDGLDNEVWLKVKTTSNHEGWIYIGRWDPYANENWSIVGTIELNGHEIKLRKCIDGLFMWCIRRTKAYDRPSFNNSNVVWTTEYTEDSWEINVEALYVLDETIYGDHGVVRWVKVRDSYGRIGWIFSDELHVSRGGNKFHTPESFVMKAFMQA